MSKRKISSCFGSERNEGKDKDQEREQYKLKEDNGNKENIQQKLQFSGEMAERTHAHAVKIQEPSYDSSPLSLGKRQKSFSK